MGKSRSHAFPSHGRGAATLRFAPSGRPVPSTPTGSGGRGCRATAGNGAPTGRRRMGRDGDGRHERRGVGRRLHLRGRSGGGAEPPAPRGICWRRRWDGSARRGTHGWRNVRSASGTAHENAGCHGNAALSVPAVRSGGREGLAAAVWVRPALLAARSPSATRGTAAGLGGAAVPVGSAPMSWLGRAVEGVPKLFPNPGHGHSHDAPPVSPCPSLTSTPRPHIPSRCPMGVTGPDGTLSPFVGSPPQCHQPHGAVGLSGAPPPPPSIGTSLQCHRPPW